MDTKTAASLAALTLLSVACGSPRREPAAAVPRAAARREPRAVGVPDVAPPYRSLPELAATETTGEVTDLALTDGARSADDQLARYVSIHAPGSLLAWVSTADADSAEAPLADLAAGAFARCVASDVELPLEKVAWLALRPELVAVARAARPELVLVVGEARFDPRGCRLLGHDKTEGPIRPLHGGGLVYGFRTPPGDYGAERGLGVVTPKAARAQLVSSDPVRGPLRVVDRGPVFVAVVPVARGKSATLAVDLEPGAVELFERALSAVRPASEPRSARRVLVDVSEGVDDAEPILAVTVIPVPD